MAKPKMLAIDDEIEFIDMLQNYFVPRGYDLEVAYRGSKGIEMVKANKPEVVLMDLKMPGIDGDEVLALVRTLEPRPKEIFVTAYDDGGKTKARLLQSGAFAYFDKPIASLKDLEAMVNKAGLS